MALLTWSEENSVGVLALDSQHQALFEMLNELHAAMMTGQAKNLTGPLLRRLVDYTRTHFTAEVHLMQSAQFPGLAAHRVTHRDLIRQVQDFTRRHERGEIMLNLHLLAFLREWLIQHIQREDKAYGPWLTSHGSHKKA